MNISIIIPSYNAQKNLERTLTALLNQKTQYDYEVIVVDCSEIDSVEKICSQYEDVRCHRESERFNPGIGRNIGANLASGELLIFLDADVILESDALEQAWQYYQQGHQVFGGALELNTHVSQSPASYLEHFFFNHESQRHRPECQRNNLSSALMLFERQLFLSKGGFKDIPRMQDTELTERIRSQGILLSFTPAVVGLQIQDSPLNKVLRKIWINGKNLYFIRYQRESAIKKVALFILLPLLALLKVSRIILRHLHYQDSKGRVATLLLTPLLIISVYFWAFGLYQSMLFGKGISRKRD